MLRSMESPLTTRSGAWKEGNEGLASGKVKEGGGWIRPTIWSDAPDLAVASADCEGGALILDDSPNFSAAFKERQFPAVLPESIYPTTGWSSILQMVYFG